MVIPQRGINPYPKFDSNVETKAATYASKGYENVYYSVSGQSKASFPEGPKMA